MNIAHHGFKHLRARLVHGEPSQRIEDIRNVELVFRQGVGYDLERLPASVRGSVGLYCRRRLPPLDPTGPTP